MYEQIEHDYEKIIVLLASRQKKDFDPRGKKRWIHHHYVLSKMGDPTDGVEDREESGIVVKRVHDGL